MSISRATVLSMAIIFILAGCASVPKSNEPEVSDKPVVLDKPEVLDKSKDLNPGGPQFSAGISNYEDGKYALAEKNLKEALGQGLDDPIDKVTAHKYLAFLYCVSSRKTLCKAEFKKAFELDPGFTLSPSEEGHPMWRKVYRQVKDQMTPVKQKK
jgi:Tfp pilus assembly protein PilF